MTFFIFLQLVIYIPTIFALFVIEFLINIVIYTNKTYFPIHLYFNVSICLPKLAIKPNLALPSECNINITIL